jgi:hypothetical protein
MSFLLLRATAIELDRKCDCVSAWDVCSTWFVLHHRDEGGMARWKEVLIIAYMYVPELGHAFRQMHTTMHLSIDQVQATGLEGGK